MPPKNLQLKLVAKVRDLLDTCTVSRKDKLIAKLKTKSGNFTWNELESLMKLSGFSQHSSRGGGSGRMFVHLTTRVKLRLHEPHPHNTLLPYMAEQVIEALRTANELGE